MMNRLAVVLIGMALLYSYAEAKSKGSKCAKVSKKGSLSQITVSPSGSAAAGQFQWAAGVATNACNCTKGQAVYNVQGSTNTSVTAGWALAVSCNTSSNLAIQAGSKKIKVKKPANLNNPPLLIFSFTSSKGKTVNYGVLNCPGTSSSGNSSSGSATFNKKAGFGKFNCGKQQGKKGTKTAPVLGSKKGKKSYAKVKAVSCSGKSGLKKCKVGASSTSG